MHISFDIKLYIKGKCQYYKRVDDCGVERHRYQRTNGGQGCRLSTNQTARQLSSGGNNHNNNNNPQKIPSPLSLVPFPSTPCQPERKEDVTKEGRKAWAAAACRGDTMTKREVPKRRKELVRGCRGRKRTFRFVINFTKD